MLSMDIPYYGPVLYTEQGWRCRSAPLRSLLEELTAGMREDTMSWYPDWLGGLAEAVVSLFPGARIIKRDAMAPFVEGRVY